MRSSWADIYVRLFKSASVLRDQLFLHHRSLDVTQLPGSLEYIAIPVWGLCKDAGHMKHKYTIGNIKRVLIVVASGTFI